MKSTLLATASLAGLLAASQFAVAAPAPNSGFGQLNLGYGWTDGSKNGNDVFDDPTTYGGRVQVYLPLSQPVQFQGDLFAQRSDNVVHGGESGWTDAGPNDATTFGAAVHVIHPMENMRVGIVGSVFNTDAFAPEGNGRVDFKYALGALELQYYTGPWTLMGQTGLFGALSTDGVEGRVRNGFFFRGGATYYCSPNTAISGEGLLFFGDDSVGFFNGKMSGGSVMLRGEHRFDNSPFSGFLTVGYENERGSTGAGSASEDTFTVSGGIRIYWDQDSLETHGRTGASFDTPDLAHPLAVEGILQNNTFAP